MHEPLVQVDFELFGDVEGKLRTSKARILNRIPSEKPRRNMLTQKCSNFLPFNSSIRAGFNFRAVSFGSDSNPIWGRDLCVSSVGTKLVGVFSYSNFTSLIISFTVHQRESFAAWRHRLDEMFQETHRSRSAARR